MSTLQYQWFLIYATAAASAILCYFICWFTRWLFGRSWDKEDTSSANAEVIAYLRPYIAEIGLPDPSVIDAIISSTARSHGLSAENMNSVRMICEDLMREILADVYMPLAKKEEYTARLRVYLANGPQAGRGLLTTEVLREAVYEGVLERRYFSRRFFLALSIAFSLLSGVAGGFLRYAVYVYTGGSLADSSLSALWVCLGLSGVFLALLAYACLIPPKPRAPKKAKTAMGIADIDEGAHQAPPVEENNSELAQSLPWDPGDDAQLVPAGTLAASSRVAGLLAESFEENPEQDQVSYSISGSGIYASHSVSPKKQKSAKKNAKASQESQK